MNLFEHEEKDDYKQVRVGNFCSNNQLNMTVIVIIIKPYQLKNILIKLDHN